jgi:hypothetical protein
MACQESHWQRQFSQNRISSSPLCHPVADAAFAYVFRAIQAKAPPLAADQAAPAAIRQPAPKRKPSPPGMSDVKRRFSESKRSIRRPIAPAIKQTKQTMPYTMRGLCSHSMPSQFFCLCIDEDESVSWKKLSERSYGSSGSKICVA